MAGIDEGKKHDNRDKDKEIQYLQGEIQEIKNSVIELFEIVTEMGDKKEIEQQRIERMVALTTQTAEKMQLTDKKMDQVIKTQRRSTIVMLGVPDIPDQNPVNDARRAMGIVHKKSKTMGIITAYRKGKQPDGKNKNNSNQNYCRPLFVELENASQAQ